MNEQFLFQLGSTITALQNQIQQLAQALQQQSQQLQETRDSLEALARSENKEWSPISKTWV